MGRKIAKHHRAKQTLHGKQSVKKLMAHGASASSIELSGDTKGKKTLCWSNKAAGQERVWCMAKT